MCTYCNLFHSAHPRIQEIQPPAIRHRLCLLLVSTDHHDPFFIRSDSNLACYFSAFTHTGFSELPAIITEPPTTYIKDRVFGCFFDDETGIANREAIGVGQLLFETDYPHQDSTWPHTDKVIAKIASQVSEAELEMILRTNALRMLNLD